MEFKFRAVDHRPPMYFSPTSGAGYFYEQALGASYPNADPRQITEQMQHVLIQRQIAKKRIREEIIAQEMAWQQELEAEVRRELMMERAMAMRVGLGGTGMSFEERLTMQFDSRQPLSLGHFVNQFDCRWLEEHLALQGCGMLNMLPSSENHKDKFIFLEKPDPNLYEAKRKAATPAEGGTSELPFAGIKKKPKEEWSCALCKVSATSETGLNEHLQGRKHKAKEAGLRAQRMAKNPNNASLPKKTGELAKLITDAAGSELGAKSEGESLKHDNTDDNSDKKAAKKKGGNKKNKLPVLQNKHAESLKTSAAEAFQVKERAPELGRNKKFKFWCERCQIGAYFEVVMEAHKKGKKHLTRHQESCENKDVAIITSLAIPGGGVKAKDSEFVAQELKDSKIVAGEAKDSELIAEEPKGVTTEIVSHSKMAETIVTDAEDNGGRKGALVRNRRRNFPKR